MSDEVAGPGREPGSGLDEATIAAMQAALPQMAAGTVAAVTSQVPDYARAGAEMDANIQSAVELALGAFLRRATGTRPGATGAPSATVLEAAYDLGRGEANSGRTLVALLSAYRAGASAAWQEMSDLMVERNVDSATVAHFAALVFAYIDELSASSAAGHADQLATTGRVKEQYLERLGVALLNGAPPDELERRAAQAGWDPPETLTAVLVPPAHLRAVASHVDPRSLILSSDVAPLPDSADTSVLLVPDVGRRRGDLREATSRRSAVIGPTQPWTDAAASYRRALTVRALLPIPRTEPLDADEHLVEIVLGADLAALADLRTQALAPLSDLRPDTAERLAATLRSWFLHQGRREAVAQDLHIHAQTVRYRMNQLRDLFGDQLTEPSSVLAITVALAVDPPVVGATDDA